ncbi:hypothetical protein [Kitasatospora viridis]|uniref:Uncharacterized protein n=1 Tax=Kitasatospora viridis TaxID=281105 RepID=A0A561UGX6_9ACTN|nr:hypothetical protein [Kitasatospora viridis]TWF98601.1 hypothetical protein FHX73_112422 [Kitasatospora viridis]
MPPTALARTSHSTIVSAPGSGADRLHPTVVPPPVGRFHAGRRVDNRPESLPQWRVSSTSSEVAIAVGRLLGGTAAVGDQTAEVLTTSHVVRVILDGPHSISTEMRLWGPKGVLHHCDGARFLTPAKVQGTPCGCPDSAKERVALAKVLRAPQPETTVTFRLADHYSLGWFEFSSPSRMLADEAGDIRTKLSSVVGEALCELSLDLVTVTVAGSADVSFRRPRLNVIGPWS